MSEVGQVKEQSTFVTKHKHLFFRDTEITMSIGCVTSTKSRSSPNAITCPLWTSWSPLPVVAEV
jgi:hypothetical protein